MKPNFALKLSLEGISLLYRSDHGWDLVGNVDLDTSSLTADLAALREAALRIDADGVRTKLVLPDEQIRFLQFDSDGLTQAQIGDAARRHLHGATPYHMDDLAFDWSVSAGQVYVAAVARETLAEAEEFASQHGFDPVCFVAAPDTRIFVGEPWFGRTRHADTLLPQGTEITRDTVAVRITGTLPPPEIRFDATARSLPTDATEAREAEPEDDHDAPASAPDPAAPVTFASIRAPRQAPQLTEPDLTAPDAQIIPETPEPGLTFATQRSTGRQDGQNAPLAEPEKENTVPVATPKSASEQEPVTDRNTAPDTTPDTPTDTAPDTKPPQDIVLPTTATGFQSRRTPMVDLPKRQSAPLAKDPQHVNPFVAQQITPTQPARRSTGVVLTAVLLLCLAGIAAWAAFFLEDTPNQQVAAPSAQDIDDAVAAAIEAPSDEVGLPRDVAPAETTETSDLRLASLPDAAPDDASDTTDLSRAPADAKPSEEEARQTYAVTGIWQRAPETPRAPEVLSLDDFYQTSIDPRVLEQDAVALPDPRSFAQDTRPLTPTAPAPAGTQFDLDTRGLVRATPDGALTPSGVQVFAGRPAFVPPARPEETLVPSPTADEPGEDDESSTADTSRLAEVRPRPRPADLREQNERQSLGTGGRTQAELAALRPNPRPPSAQEIAEQAAAASTAGLADTDDAADPFAGATAQAVALSMMPKPRPDAFEDIVRKAEQQKRGQEQAAQQQATQSNTQQATQPLQTAAATTPRAQTTTPRIPTATSVARAATEKNVLRLRQVNLIGVYGAPSDRRALVRLPNGRYKKVQIGDRLDGGRVTAIGASELRYQKSGRSVALKMPQG